MMAQVATLQETPETPASQPRWLVLVLAVALIVAIAAAVASFLVFQPPAEDSPEVTFARDMTAHHEQAVGMAMTIRDRSSDPELRQFALDIMLTQQSQIGQMQGWLATWGRPNTGSTPPMQNMGEMMGMATSEELSQLDTLPVAEAETVFLQLMLRHHQGGVAMAEEAMKTMKRPESRRLAESIIAGQQSEIAYMESLLAARGASPLPPPAMVSGGH